ncbi:MAG TPA: hypothetical protein VIS99_01660, partial [Terrimicrobiaceae bacterium]
MLPAICLDPLYPGLLTEEKIPRIAAAGFRHIEFWGWRDKHIPAIQAACRNHDVQVINFSGHRTGSPAAEKTHSVLFADVSDAVPTGRTPGCRTLTLLTNALNPDGSVADRFEEITETRRVRLPIQTLALYGGSGTAARSVGAGVRLYHSLDSETSKIGSPPAAMASAPQT